MMAGEIPGLSGVCVFDGSGIMKPLCRKQGTAPFLRTVMAKSGDMVDLSQT